MLGNKNVREGRDTIKNKRSFVSRETFCARRIFSSEMLCTEKSNPNQQTTSETVSFFLVAHLGNGMDADAIRLGQRKEKSLANAGNFLESDGTEILQHAYYSAHRKTDVKKRVFPKLRGRFDLAERRSTVTRTESFGASIASVRVFSRMQTCYNNGKKTEG